MNNTKIKEQNRVLDGNKFVITKQVEEVYNEGDLLNKRNNIMMQISNIKQQMVKLKNQYDLFVVELADTENMLAQLLRTSDVIMENVEV